MIYAALLEVVNLESTADLVGFPVSRGTPTNALSWPVSNPIIRLTKKKWTEHLVFVLISKVFGAQDLSRSTRLDEICILARSQPLGRSESRVWGTFMFKNKYCFNLMIGLDDNNNYHTITTNTQACGPQKPP